MSILMEACLSKTVVVKLAFEKLSVGFSVETAFFKSLSGFVCVTKRQTKICTVKVKHKLWCFCVSIHWHKFQVHQMGGFSSI